jgi:hypothetical protein
MASVGTGETAPNAAWLARKIAGSREARRPTISLDAPQRLLD